MQIVLVSTVFCIGALWGMILNVTDQVMAPSTVVIFTVKLWFCLCRADFNIQFLLPEYDGTHQQAYSSPVDCTEHVSLPYCSPCYSCSSYASSYIGGGREVDGEADEGEGWMVELVEEGEAWMGEADSEANERGGWMVGVDGEVDGEVHVEKDLGRKVDGESDGEVKKAKKADGEVDGEANRERGVDRGADEGEGRTGRL